RRTSARATTSPYFQCGRGCACIEVGKLDVRPGASPLLGAQSHRLAGCRSRQRHTSVSRVGLTPCGGPPPVRPGGARAGPEAPPATTSPGTAVAPARGWWREEAKKNRCRTAIANLTHHPIQKCNTVPEQLPWKSGRKRKRGQDLRVLSIIPGLRAV